MTNSRTRKTHLQKQELSLCSLSLWEITPPHCVGSYCKSKRAQLWKDKNQGCPAYSMIYGRCLPHLGTNALSSKKIQTLWELHMKMGHKAISQLPTDFNLSCQYSIYQCPFPNTWTWPISQGRKSLDTWCIDLKMDKGKSLWYAISTNEIAPKGVKAESSLYLHTCLPSAKFHVPWNLQKRPIQAMEIKGTVPIIILDKDKMLKCLSVKNRTLLEQLIVSFPRQC